MIHPSDLEVKVMAFRIYVKVSITCVSKPERKRKTQISFAVTVKLISAFVFATQIEMEISFQIQNVKLLAIFCDCTDWFVSDLFGNYIVGFLTRPFTYPL